MRLCLGPVAPDAVLAWGAWAHEVLGGLRHHGNAGVTLPDRVLDDIEGYVAEWERTAGRSKSTFHWTSDVHPDQLEYLTNALYNLDLRLAADSNGTRTVSLSGGGRVFHLALVSALLATLALESPSHAGFVHQMRESWSSAAEAG